MILLKTITCALIWTVGLIGTMLSLLVLSAVLFFIIKMQFKD